MLHLVHYINFLCMLIYVLLWIVAYCTAFLNFMLNHTHWTFKACDNEQTIATCMDISVAMDTGDTSHYNASFACLSCYISIKCHYCTDISGCVPSNLVTRTQLINSQDLSSAESLSKQVNCPHLAAEHTVGICCLRRSQETLVKRLQEERCR